MSMQDILINKEPVELYKILKFMGMSASGADAKNLVADGMVKVNGQIELQKRKKIVSGDVIEFDGQKFKARLEA